MHSKGKKGNLPKIENVIVELISKGFEASRTHFSPTGIKTNASEKDINNSYKH